MRRVALLAYYFPPVGGGGVQRPLALARWLPEFGWEPVVVTGPASSEDRWSPRDAGGDGLPAPGIIPASGPQPRRGRGGMGPLVRGPPALAPVVAAAAPPPPHRL